ncbi:MAG: hypothetical protein M1816_006459 [Peltula sp. TS41687]|nr:MAG: hypothetical protein M1816_006459 [Peltula sp. TS41687]
MCMEMLWHFKRSLTRSTWAGVYEITVKSTDRTPERTVNLGRVGVWIPVLDQEESLILSLLARLARIGDTGSDDAKGFLAKEDVEVLVDLRDGGKGAAQGVEEVMC